MTPLLALLDAIDDDASLALPARLRARIDALDELECCLTLVDAAEVPPALISRARKVAGDLEALNSAVYRSIRDDIRLGSGARLLEWAACEACPDGDGYDRLDDLISGVLQLDQPLGTADPLPSDMVFYQPTPARHIFDMLARTTLGSRDVLVDLGAGLGHVPLVAAICSDAHAIGIEREPAYVACARKSATDLALQRVAFHEQDARAADFSLGTVFYMYTPFRGAIMRDVLDRMRQAAATREIRICTFGPCTQVLSGEPWLSSDDDVRSDRIAIFRSKRDV